MKLQYLTQVQKLLEDYDFQDKYKIMLELEESISKLEVGGKIDQSLLFSELGTPAQFVHDVIGTYDLLKINDPSLKDLATTNMDDLMNATQNITKSSQAENSDTIEIEPLDNNPNNATSNNDENSQKKVKKQLSNESNNKSEQAYEHQKASKQTSSSSKKSKQKKPVKIIFGLLMAIFYLIGFIGLAFTIVLAIGLLIFIDIQTALGLFLGILFLLLTIGLSISFVKNLIYSIIDREVKVFTLGIRIIFIIVFALLSKIMLSSSLETVGLYITNNLYTIQNIFIGYNVDISNINWDNLDFGEYVKLFGDIVKSVF